nr:restriction endonuclease subunit S [Corynebacterium lactis]
MPKHNVPALRVEGFEAEWESTTFEKLSGRTYGGGTPSSDKPSYWAGDIPWIQSSDVAEHDISPVVPRRYITKEAVSRSAATEIPAGSVAVVTRVGVGKVSFMPFPYASSQDFVSLSDLSGHPEYIALTVKRRMEELADQLQGSTIKGITKADLLNQAVYFPPALEEQQAIGEIFTKLDTAIDQHTKKHTSLQQAKTALMQRMFPQEGQSVPELRLDGFDGEWTSKRLYELAKVIDSARIHNSLWTSGGIRYVRSSDVRTGFRHCNLYISQETFDRYSRMTGFPKRGDVLFTSGGEIGIPHYYDSDEPIYLQGGAVLNIVTSESAELDGRFLTVLFQTEAVREYITAASTGGTIKHFVVGPAREIPVVFPPTLEEQQAIGAVFTNVDKLIAAEAAYITNLKQAKTALLQRMFV